MMQKEIPSSSVASMEEAGGARRAETLLRVLPVCLCLAALLLMIRNSVVNDYGGVSYSDLGGFRYLVYANGLCAGYSLLSAFFTARRPGPSAPSMSRAWALFFLDQILTYVILAAGAAAAEVLYLAYDGDEAVTWSKACESFGGFCHKAAAATGITFAAVLCYAAVAIFSSYRLFSVFAPPAAASSCGGGIEVAAFPR